jgi:hypothetical protein
MLDDQSCGAIGREVRSRAHASIRDDRSTPSALPSVAIRAARRVVSPQPQPMSRTWPVACHREQPVCVALGRSVVLLLVLRPVVAVVAVPGRRLVDVHNLNWLL